MTLCTSALNMSHSLIHLHVGLFKNSSYIDIHTFLDFTASLLHRFIRGLFTSITCKLYELSLFTLTIHQTYQNMFLPYQVQGWTLYSVWSSSSDISVLVPLSINKTDLSCNASNVLWKVWRVDWIIKLVSIRGNIVCFFIKTNNQIPLTFASKSVWEKYYHR